AATWAPLLGQVDAATHASLLAQVNAARQETGQAPLAESTAPSGLSVDVALAPGVRARFPGDATVFVIARTPVGPPMPVAVEKHLLSRLPLQVHLDDADSPMPTARLSALQEVEVLARVSRSGNAMRQEGDVESAPVRVSLPADAPVKVLIGP